MKPWQYPWASTDHGHPINTFCCGDGDTVHSRAHAHYYLLSTDPRSIVNDCVNALKGLT